MVVRDDSGWWGPSRASGFRLVIPGRARNSSCLGFCQRVGWNKYFDTGLGSAETDVPAKGVRDNRQRGEITPRGDARPFAYPCVGPLPDRSLAAPAQKKPLHGMACAEAFRELPRVLKAWKDCRFSNKSRVLGEMRAPCLCSGGPSSSWEGTCSFPNMHIVKKSL